MSLIKHVTLQKIVAHDFRYNPHIHHIIHCEEISLLSFSKMYEQDLLSPANRTNEKGRLDLQFWVHYRDTEVKSSAKTMKHRHYSNKKRPLLVTHSLINFIDLQFYKICNPRRSISVTVNTKRRGRARARKRERECACVRCTRTYVCVCVCVKMVWQLWGLYGRCPSYRRCQVKERKGINTEHSRWRKHKTVRRQYAGKEGLTTPFASTQPSHQDKNRLISAGIVKKMLIEVYSSLHLISSLQYPHL